MEALKETVAWLVVVGGLMSWIIFIPQFRLLLKVKESRSISAGTAWGSFALQAVIFIHALLQQDWRLGFTMFISLSCLTFLLHLIYYYRRQPGGRKRASQ